MTITYQNVFNVKEIGDELTDGQGLNYTACPAANALKRLLGAHSFFGGSKLGGTGPLYRPWDGNKHEFNRHHAGLAVDIMLNQGSAAEVALGQQLVLLFRKNIGTMKWRGMIYQNVTFTPSGASGGGGHEDHIHIDWHDIANVKWKTGITSIPLRKGGVVIQMPLGQGDKIASSIDWTTEAGTDFGADASLTSGVADLMAKHGRSELVKIPWTAGALASAQTTTLNTIHRDLAGRWRVSIGNWNGIFFFDASGNVNWAESEGSPKHPGRWTVAGSRLEWKFRDPGDFRTFTVTLPLNRGNTPGTILPPGQGWFNMAKSSDAVA